MLYVSHITCWTEITVFASGHCKISAMLEIKEYGESQGGTPKAPRTRLLDTCLTSNPEFLICSQFQTCRGNVQCTSHSLAASLRGACAGHPTLKV